MNFRFFGCGKFGRLTLEAEDRSLSEDEVLFLERHRAVCPFCVRKEQAQTLALNMLREARLETEQPGGVYDRRLLRRLRVQALRAGFSFWSPAVFGAAIAAVALVAALQMLSQPSKMPVFRAGSFEARKIQVSGPLFPQVPIADRISDMP